MLQGQSELNPATDENHRSKTKNQAKRAPRAPHAAHLHSTSIPALRRVALREPFRPVQSAATHHTHMALFFALPSAAPEKKKVQSGVGASHRGVTLPCLHFVCSKKRR